MSVSEKKTVCIIFSSLKKVFRDGKIISEERDKNWQNRVEFSTVKPVPLILFIIYFHVYSNKIKVKINNNPGIFRTVPYSESKAYTKYFIQNLV